jgi:iron complex outermembrane recepter protein
MLHNTTPRPASGARASAVAAGLFALAAVQVASAQTSGTNAATRDAELTDEPVKLDAFVVESGFRGSLAAAAEVKQTTLAIAEVIAAEDIGKLPDISIADSLSRLTGLATQRLNGRSQAINIRGLAADFTTGLLNGREQVSTGSNRAVEFDQYPAELLSGAVVYKTTQANLIGQGLAGTIDLRTVRPLSHGRRTFAANTFYDWTELPALNAGSERSGWRYSASYIDQLADGKFGLALGYAHADIPGQGEQWNAWGYPNVSAATDPSQPFVLGGAKPFVRSSELKRDGYMAVLEFKPSANVHSTLDLFYSKFKETQLLRGIEIPLWWSSARLRPGFTVQDGLITRGTFENVYGVVRNDEVLRKDDVYAVGWNVTLGGNDGWKGAFDVNYSKINRKDTVLETYSGTASNQVGTADVMTYALQGSGAAKFTPTINYADPNALRLTSPQGWGGDIVQGGQVGYLKSPTAKDELVQVKGSLQYDLPRFFKNVEIGLSYSDRYKKEVEDGYYLALANGQASAPLPQTIGTTDLSFIGIPGMASYDPIAALNSGIYTRLRNPNADVVSTDWTVKERVTLGYVQLNLDQRVGNVPMTGNVGFQLIHSDQQSKGLAATGTGNFARYLPVRDGDKYWDFVPSMNLVFEVADRRYLRLSAARQLARQRMVDMRAGSNYTYRQALATSTDPYNGPWSATGGNPKLKPWRADALDIAFEHYFRDNMGYFSLSAFYKKLKTYTYEQTALADFTGFPYDGAAPATFQGTLRRPENGSGGRLQGLEATLSLPSELLSESIRGFGVVLGGTLIDSSIEANGPGTGGVPIPGLSEFIGTATLYYERHGFAARVSARHRTEYRGNVYTFGPRGENYRTIDDETVIDAQISYAIQSGALKGITFILQANNLTDEPLVTYAGDDSRHTIDYQQYGAMYSAGISYRF